MKLSKPTQQNSPLVQYREKTNVKALHRLSLWWEVHFLLSAMAVIAAIAVFLHGLTPLGISEHHNLTKLR